MLITFSRLSADGELVALLAAGYPLKKIIMPLIFFTLLVYAVTTFCALNLEAWGRREFVQFIYRKTQMELDNIIRYRIQPGVFLTDFLGYVIYAEDISENRKVYRNVMLAPGNQEGQFVMFAPVATVNGSVENGDLKMSFYNGMAYSTNESDMTSVLKYQHAEIDILRVFQSKILGADSAKDDYRSYDFQQLIEYIRELRSQADYQKNQTYLRAFYLLLSRSANPLLVFAFCLFGIVLGISEQRHGKNTGYIGAIATVIGSFVLVVGCRWIAERGQMHPIFAAFFPMIFLILLAGFLFRQRNHLPPSESVWNIQYWPLYRFFKN